MNAEYLNSENGQEIEEIGDVFDQTCGTRKTMELISSLWSVLILHILEDGIKRYSEIRDRVAGISPKMLAQTLRYLERDGIITRKVYPVIPPRVEYGLTEIGKGLVPILNQLCNWSNNNYGNVQRARLDYVRRQISEK